MYIIILEADGFKPSSTYFEKQWSDYCDTISKMEFSPTYIIQGKVKECIEIAPEIERQNLKIGKSNHGKVTLYHLYLNINYTKHKK